MIDEIKSGKVKKVNDAFNYGSISEKELNYMAEFDDAELAEFLYLIEQGIISHNLLAYYFVVYNNSRIGKIEQSYKYSFINSLLASAWMDNFQDKDAELILDMLLGLSFINTDLILRIRKGLILKNKKSNSFDLKVESIVKALIARVDNGSLYKTLTSVDVDDHISLVEDDNIMFFHIKNDLVNISNVFELYEIRHGNYRGKEYLAKDTKKLSQYENELTAKIKDYFKLENIKDLSYLPEYYKEIILGVITGTNVIGKEDSGIFANDSTERPLKASKKSRKGNSKDLLESLSTVERENEKYEPVLNTSEDKIYGAVEKIVNRGQQKDKHINDGGPLGYHDLFVGMEERRAGSNFSVFFKVLIALFLILSVIGWGLSVRSSNSNGTDHVKDITYKEILSYKISSGAEAKYDIKVNRSGIGDAVNGTVKDNALNVE